MSDKKPPGMGLRPPYASFKLRDEQIHLLETEIAAEVEKAGGLEQGKVGNVGDARGEIRRSEILFMPNNIAVNSFCHNIFRDANRQLYGFHLEKIWDLQYTEYDASYEGHYDWHCDTIWNSSTWYQRKLSMTIQLSSSYEYEGGEFELQNTPLPATYQDKGTVLMFPSYLNHRVLPVTKGKRKSLVAWIEGPLFV